MAELPTRNADFNDGNGGDTDDGAANVSLFVASCDRVAAAASSFYFGAMLMLYVNNIMKIFSV